MGIRVIPYTSYPEEKQKLLLKMSEDGFFVEKTDNEFYIYYNDNQNYGRINNTILHEIGHIILGHTEESELAEAEVNFFAKYALVPPVLVHKLGVDNLYRIAELFDVSMEAAFYAFNYYKKWLRYGHENYTDYEIKLIDLFKFSIQI